MVNALINFSLNNRFIIILLSFAILGMGVFASATIPVDTVPDLTNVQVLVLTTSPSLGPVEVEQFITFPVENAMSGIPNVSEIRSISRFGLSAVTVAIEDGTDIYWARNLINERLLKARESIPPGMGTPELGPIATGMSEIYQFEVRGEPGSEYKGKTKADLVEQMKESLDRNVPGNSYSFTQPIELRVQELVAGVRSDIGLSLYGDDLEVLKLKGDELVRALNQVEGAADVQAQQIAGLSYMRVIVRRGDLARYGINTRDVLNAISTIGGMPVSQVFEGQRRFPLQVRLQPQSRENTEPLLALKINDAKRRPIPISQVADIVIEDGPVEISRDAARWVSFRWRCQQVPELKSSDLLQPS